MSVDGHIDRFTRAFREWWVEIYQSDQRHMEIALAMVWSCLGDDWTRVVIEVHESTPLHGQPLPERRIVDQGRVIHRQWWEVDGLTLTLRQEWCP